MIAVPDLSSFANPKLKIIRPDVERVKPWVFGLGIDLEYPPRPPEA